MAASDDFGWSFTEPDDSADVLQGDIVDEVTVATPTPQDGVVEAPARVIVVSHSCEYTKTAGNPGYPILVAPIVELDGLPGGLGGLIRRDSVTRYWRLPIARWFEVESAVDLSLVQPVLGADLLGGVRVCSMTASGRIALADRLFSMLSLRRRPDDA